MTLLAGQLTRKNSAQIILKSSWGAQITWINCGTEKRLNRTEGNSSVQITVESIQSRTSYFSCASFVSLSCRSLSRSANSLHVWT